MVSLTMVSVGATRATDQLLRLARRVEARLAFPPRVVAAPLDIERCLDRGRGQYDAMALLRQLSQWAEQQRVRRVLGLTAEDLFVASLTHVYGLAQLDGAAAVVSSYRLVDRPAADSSRVLDRLEKEVLHELGHTCGLVHCRLPVCVMSSSTRVEEIDLKGHWFCPSCAPAIRQRLTL